MTGAPERIWVAAWREGDWSEGDWDDNEGKTLNEKPCIQYVQADRIEDLEAKLAKAVEALEKAATDMDDYVGRGYGDCFRDTIAEIKGT